MRNPRLRAKMSVLQQPEALSPDLVGEQVGDIYGDARRQL